MTDEPRRTAQDIGSDSPAGESAKEQRIAGTKGGPRAGRQAARTGKQPPQTSGRRGAAHEQDAHVRKGYEAARDPSRQGDGDPGPRQLKERSSQQGHAGHGARGRGARADDATERSHAGEPQGGHTRQGRQRVPGDRDPQQSS